MQTNVSPFLAFGLTAISLGNCQPGQHRSPAATTDAAVACSPWTARDLGPVRDNFEIVDRGGRVAEGSILFIGQIHANPFFRHEEQPWAQAHQYAIVTLLNQARPRTLFVEDVPADWESNRVRLPGFRAARETPEVEPMVEGVLQFISGGLPAFEDLTGPQRYTLQTGAVMGYAALDANVLIHRTNTFAELTEANREYEALHESGEVSLENPAFERLQRRRENWLAREITGYLREHRTQNSCRVAVIFGSGHLQDRRIEDAFAAHNAHPHILAVTAREERLPGLR